ncbi:glycine receptor subunit alpha-2-like [Pollicipes pollicipes]|nr:glycine receptor subunit alpha-2-like [Pollicipes pollicipes]
MFFLWHTFLPCVLLVATSWLSMLLPPEVIPGRMVLCITSLLALLTMFTSSLTGLEVSYIRASDIWYVGCLVFDFLIILEYVVLIFIQRERKAEDGPTWARPRHIHPAEKLTKKSLSRASLGSSARWRDVDPARMDRVSRWALVVLFASFAFGYWCYYCL